MQVSYVKEPEKCPNCGKLIIKKDAATIQKYCGKPCRKEFRSKK